MSKRLRLRLWRLGVFLVDEQGEVNVLAQEIDMLIARLVEARRWLKGNREDNTWR